MARRGWGFRGWSTLLSLALAAACGGEPPVGEPVIRPVRTSQVFSTGSEQVRSFTGSTQAGAEIALSFKVPGTVMHLFVRVGDSVEKGQLIAELDPSDYELREGQARASRALRLAEKRNRESQYDRVRALYENNNASRTELDAARAQAESADSLLEAASKSLELATKQLSYTRLEAPVAGLVAEVFGDENENVVAGQTAVVVASGTLPEVKIAIPGLLISQVHRGDRVMVRLPTVEGPTLPATVIEVGVSAALGRTTFPVTAELHEDHPAIRPGMAAKVEFRFAGDGEGRLLQRRIRLEAAPADPGVGIDGGGIVVGAAGEIGRRHADRLEQLAHLVAGHELPSLVSDDYALAEELDRLVALVLSEQ